MENCVDDEKLVILLKLLLIVIEKNAVTFLTTDAQGRGKMSTLFSENPTRPFIGL